MLLFVVLIIKVQNTITVDDKKKLVRMDGVTERWQQLCIIYDQFIDNDEAFKDQSAAVGEKVSYVNQVITLLSGWQLTLCSERSKRLIFIYSYLHINSHMFMQ